MATVHTLLRSLVHSKRAVRATLRVPKRLRAQLDDATTVEVVVHDVLRQEGQGSLGEAIVARPNSPKRFNVRPQDLTLHEPPPPRPSARAKR
jgi:hypothetical protein